MKDARAVPSLDGEVKPRLRVGLVNNMPDAALAVTERQFRDLLTAAAPDRELELLLFELPEITRKSATRARMAGRYRPAGALDEIDLDAMVVTGADPGRAPLKEAAFWPSFTRLVDWATETGTPTLWSCLAAHAAVEHLDGVERRRLPAKHSGVFACEAVGDILLEGLKGVWPAPHSRLNDLDEAELVASGYEILTRSDLVGVDVFVRRGPPLFLFCQGHPEYDRKSLALEYQRDMQAFARGEREAPPAPPADFRSPELLEAERADPRGGWAGFAVRLYANWLSTALAERAAPARASRDLTMTSPAGGL
jgi:homoserine O-succinyltransferase